ncbi:zinc finger bed domain-containing protein 1-like [Phytophthora cinnamomi]|nr:zinc finger bed domain-containing protein 1-like [Phytophthora cinnamomi]
MELMPVLEPGAVVDEGEEAKSPADDAAQAGPHHVEDVAAGLGRRRGRGGRDKAEPAMVLPSFIWDYFVKDASGKFVVCTLCPAQTTRFAYSGGTSTMNRHLRKKHHKYAPGKCAADYEYPRGLQRRALQQQLQSLASPAGGAVAAASAGLLLAPDTAGVLGSLSPGEPLGGKQRHQLLELRTARRRAASGGAAASKRRKLVVDPADQAAALGAAASSALAAEFDPAGFVTLAGPAAGAATSGALQFPAGFELNDAAIDLDQRFFDYSTLAGAGPTAAGGLLRGRRHSSSISGNSASGSAVNNAANQKILTHRLLKYLIAQYEPLDVSHMGAELGMLLFGGSTEWPTPGLNFGYGGALGFGGGGMGGSLPKLPSEDTIKLALANLYYSQREILKEVMADVEVLSLSLNNWTSAFGQNVLTVSGHWISRGFRRRDCVLEVYVLPLDERVNTIALLRDVMDNPRTAAEAQAEAQAEANAIHSEYPGLAVNPSEYQIFLALQRSMGEEASAASAASAQTASIAATADGVSVSIAEGGNSTMGDELDGVKEGQNSDVTAEDGTSASQNGATAPPASASNGTTGEALPVICDFDDRWNSTTQMMCRIVQLELMLLHYKTGLESDTNPARRPMQLRFVCCELSPEEWASLKQLARLLEPIEGLVHVSPLAYPGLSIVYPLLHSLKKHLADAGTWVTDPLVATVRHTIVTNLNMDLCSSGQAPSSPYLSCLLDPRFKSLPFLPPSEKEGLVESLYLLLGVSDKDDGGDDGHGQHDPVPEEDQSDEHKKQDQNGKGSSTSAASASLTNKKTAALLHEFFPLDEPATELDKLKTQVQQYLDSPSLPATDESEHDPLEWWSRYQRLFPSLARLAKKYLCISAVSTPFQEAFTNYGQLMREKKARLDIEVAAQVLFCRSVSRIPEMERIGV